MLFLVEIIPHPSYEILYQQVFKKGTILSYNIIFLIKSIYHETNMDGRYSFGLVNIPVSCNAIAPFNRQCRHQTFNIN